MVRFEPVTTPVQEQCSNHYTMLPTLAATMYIRNSKRQIIGLHLARKRFLRFVTKHYETDYLLARTPLGNNLKNGLRK